MFSDPSGHAIITTIIIGAIIGATVGFGKTVYNDYQDDGDIFNGSIGAGDYVATTLTWTAIGGAVGTVVGLGGAASGISSLTADIGSDAIFTIISGENQFGTLEDYAFSFLSGGISNKYKVAVSFLEPIANNFANSISNGTNFNVQNLTYDVGVNLVTNAINYRSIKVGKFDINWSQSMAGDFFNTWESRYR